MNQHLETFIKRAEAVTYLLTIPANIIIVDSYQAFKAERNILFPLVDGLKVEFKRKMEVISGITKDKGDLDEDIATMGDEICRKSRAYALRVDDNEFFGNVNYTRSVFLNMNEEVKIAKGREIIDIVHAQIANLVTYEVTQQMLDDWGAKIDEYESKINELNIIEDKSKNKNDHIWKLVHDIDLCLKIMKDLSVHYKVIQKAFYKAFQSALEYDDMPHKKISIILTAIDKVTKLPIHDVTVKTIISDKPITRKSSLLGQNMFKDLPDGTYTFSFFRNDYLEKIIEVKTIPNELVRVVVELEKS